MGSTMNRENSSFFQCMEKNSGKLYILNNYFKIRIHNSLKSSVVIFIFMYKLMNFAKFI